jgi:hypothetical protein
MAEYPQKPAFKVQMRHIHFGSQLTHLDVSTKTNHPLNRTLVDKLNKAIASKDKAAFEECMDFDKSNPSTVKNIHKLEDQIFAWDKAYIDIVDPVFFDQLKPQISASGNTILTYEKGTKELKGKYLFDVHICKDLPSKHGYSFNCAGGTIDGIPKILSNILDNVSPNNPSPTPQ